MALDINYYKKKDARSISLAFWLFISVAVLTLALFFYNSYLSKNNVRLETELKQMQTSIDELRKDKNIESYYLYSQNKASFEKLKKQSNITPIIEHLMSVMIRYDLVFNSFSYNEGKISLRAYSESSEWGLAYKKIVKFIDEYNMKEDSLFHIDSISEYTGHDKIEFPLSMKLK